ncbi:Arc family DNA-binding protein [Pseudomonas sp.]|uniref:Arc family DNA-binding protein n=1 Tax=Pseudomonas sp. TaxID=306 RepID=UPI00345D0E53
MRDLSRTQIRFPCELMEWLKQQAREQNRSMNSQLVEIVEQARVKAKSERA